MATTELLPDVERDDPEMEVTFDLECVRTAIVNCFLYGPRGAGDREWVLVDAGLFGFGHRIVKAAAERFGPDSRPSAIVLTHGHFDHVGALRELSEAWDCPIYAHRLELPYLDGRSAYPPPDPSVGGGAMARMSMLYPRGPYDFSERLRVLPENGTVPGMPGWRWIHTPGHTAGHVALFRDSDRTLIAGDAFVTTKQESLMAVIEQRPEVNGPPSYYTTDWDAARASVQALAMLRPEYAGTGHGIPMRGKGLRQALELLARDFEMLAVPRDGRYVRAPALTDENGVVSVPPAVGSGFPLILLGLGAAAVLGIALGARIRRESSRRWVAEQEAAMLAATQEPWGEHLPVGPRPRWDTSAATDWDTGGEAWGER
ncbi:MAG TPA: MBL fold metallo-hydrolase [Longimicrobium sp.]|nr:MBL fold metallo-hydrolase [Longimicrobium sp.]